MKSINPGQTVFLVAINSGKNLYLIAGICVYKIKPIQLVISRINLKYGKNIIINKDHIALYKVKHLGKDIRS
ncbi:hypothetical protein NF27_BA00100 [Candidatus Jidaibacter acanthamoeba]|uniref:Uncharacterized protein n=1 Tax=Candidatus Jidaibacter acanthamoebae TaxID=86105 RepID=A0A0C1MVI1_9RICK|nr:hypothetical protein NF27_BA00100 [Candidatus Jidaibacter acanthamoeba]